MGSFRQIVPDASEPPGGWLTWQGPGTYVEEEGEEDEWTDSSYKAFWTERDAEDRAARQAAQGQIPPRPDVFVQSPSGPGS